ncbi:MAG: amidohydrolase family protein [Gammaproteobacteria bacterium]|nr:amidohydrolase family protein [Gammaproteobacteria bacterium]
MPTRDGGGVPTPQPIAATVLVTFLCVASPGCAEIALLPPDKSVLDLHVHTAGIGAGGSGCFISRGLRGGHKFGWYLGAFGTSLKELEREGDAVILSHISARVADSASVSKAVVLAMDGVVDAAGELDREHTQLYVPNEFLAREVRRFPNLLFGASVNPYRRDALQRLEQVKQDGAVLVKWIPAIMHIDPADPALTPFYAKLKELDLPLLVHVGQERSFGPARDELGDPARLELALEAGVTVIAAHIATTGRNEGEDNFKRILPLFGKYPNLYTEISSLTQINKMGYLYKALRYPGLPDRMLFGTDWPLQFFPLVSPWYQMGRVPLRRLSQLGKLDNQWDRDVALKRAMGVPDAVFDRTWEVLKIPRE